MAAFNLVSLDVANLDNPGSPIPVSPGGGFRIEVSGVPGGDDVYGPGSSTFVTESPTDLTNISQLDINIVSYTPEAATFAVDNIVLSSTVPEPSTWAMMLLDLRASAMPDTAHAEPPLGRLNAASSDKEWPPSWRLPIWDDPEIPRLPLVARSGSDGALRAKNVTAMPKFR